MNKIFEVINSLENVSVSERTNANISKEKQMLAITYDTGRFLNLLLKMMNATKVLEIGTSVGYSMLWLAEAVLSNLPKSSSDLSLITIEQDKEKISRALGNFEKAQIRDYVRIIHNDALSALLSLTHDRHHDKYFDFVFIDADKERIKEYFDLVFPLLKYNGIIVADNMLEPIEYREIMKEYKQYITEKNLTTITIPIGFGEELTIKRYAES